VSGFEEPLTCVDKCDAPPTYLEHQLHLQADELMKKMHALTRRRDTEGTPLFEMLPLELSLVMELGRIQDRLRLLGVHEYDGCVDCSPGRPPLRNCP
jgi:hypothetical protein